MEFENPNTKSENAEKDTTESCYFNVPPEVICAVNKSIAKTWEDEKKEVLIAGLTIMIDQTIDKNNGNIRIANPVEEQDLRFGPDPNRTGERKIAEAVRDAVVNSTGLTKPPISRIISSTYYKSLMDMQQNQRLSDLAANDNLSTPRKKTEPSHTNFPTTLRRG